MRPRISIAFVGIAFAVLAAARAADDPAGPANKAAPPQDAVSKPAPPPSVTVIGARDAHGILGRDVRSAANEDMGRIVDVIVDREGTVRAGGETHPVKTGEIFVHPPGEPHQLTNTGTVDFRTASSIWRDSPSLLAC